jgi:hypothetical protein
VAHVAPLGNDQTPEMNSTAAPWTTSASAGIGRGRPFAPQPTATLSVWKDAAFLHYRAANILLQITVWLFSHGLLPTSALEGALRLSSRLKDRGAYFHAQLRWRRLRDRL